MKIYRAVIENNQSPNKDGRLQVRIYSIHDPDKEKVKTEHLPWAEVMQSTAFGFSSGVGFTSIPNIGTWVFVILDHDNPNMPIVIGAISGKSEKGPDSSKGFNHPEPLPYNIEDYKFPIEDRLKEEDQNRLQRVEKLDETIHKAINDTLDIFTKTDGTSGANVSQTEPSSLSDLSKYPDDAVIETKSGHVIEIDDTPGNEKIRLYHRTGTYIDYRPDGSISEKVKQNINKIVEGYIHTHIKGSVKTYVNQNLDEIIEGKVSLYIDKTMKEHIKGKVNLDYDSDVIWNIGKNLTINVGETIKINSGGTQTNINGGNYTHIAPNIHLNP